MLTYEKQQNVIGLVQKAKGDTQKLYKIVNKIIGKRDQNPFPDGKSDEQLAEEFADYFYNKIVNIRKTFCQDKLVEIETTDVPNFVLFAPFVSAQIEKIIIRPYTNRSIKTNSTNCNR